MTEEHPARGWYEVAAIGQPLGRSGPTVVESEHLRGQEAAKKASCREVAAAGGQPRPGGSDGLSPMQRQHPPPHCAGHRQRQPAELFEQHVRTLRKTGGRGKVPVSPTFPSCPSLFPPVASTSMPLPSFGFGHRPRGGKRHRREPVPPAGSLVRSPS